MGTEVVSAITIEDDGWPCLVPVTFVTDCRSIFDTVRKDGQHIWEKGTVIHAVLLRQLLTARPDGVKANLMWVPTRCQLADAVTKCGRAPDLRDHLQSGMLFHEMARPKKVVRPKKVLDQCEKVPV